VEPQCDNGYMRIILAAMSVVVSLALTSPVVAQSRVMPLGDSITEAETGFSSYRYWLWNELLDDGYDVDMVGSMSGVYNGPPLNPDFDQDHEGHWGWRADEILGQLAVWAAATQPEVVLLHLGHNDLWQGQGVASTIADLSAIIDVLRTENPTVTVLFAQVIPSTVSGLSEIPGLNTEIATLAASLTTPGSPVVVVDQWTGFDPVTDTYDGVHPNALGEQKMAARWLTGLAGVLEPTALVFADGFESGDTTGWTIATIGAR